MDSTLDEMLDEMTEPRYLLAKQEARLVWQKLGSKKIPVILNEIVKELGIPVKAEQLECDGLSRMDQNGLCFIMYKPSVPVTRQRFTVAHEIGHIVLEHLHLGSDTSQSLGSTQEKEADAFAGELLIPSSDLKKFTKDKDKTIEDIVERYQVSKGAASSAINGNRLLNRIKVADPTTRTIGFAR